MTEMLEPKAADDSLRVTSVQAGEDKEVQELLCLLSEVERERLTVLQRLLTTAEQPGYGKRDSKQRHRS